MKYSKYLGVIFISFLTWYIGNNFYLYYYNTTDPIVTIHGIHDDSFFAKNITATIAGTHPYKISNYSMTIDGKPYKQNIMVNRSSFENSIVIPVDTLDNGKHTLMFTTVSGTNNHNTVQSEHIFYVDNAELQAGFIKPESENKVLQGRCFHVQFKVNKPIKQAMVTALSKKFIAYPEAPGSLVYETFIPLDCDQHPSEYAFSVAIQDHVGNNFDLHSSFSVTAFPFKKKTLHVPSGALAKEGEFTSLGEKDFELKMEELSQNSVQEKLWHGVFEIPLAMTNITTEFGIQRVAQERGCYVHKAIDMVAAAPRSVVWASQAGIVVLKERYAHSGNTIIIDHGYGILSMYFHLETYANIEVGQKLKKGNPVGTMGKTGYANGYHLHWEIRVGNVAIDPMQWTKRDFIS